MNFIIFKVIFILQHFFACAVNFWEVLHRFTSVFSLFLFDQQPFTIISSWAAREKEMWQELFTYWMKWCCNICMAFILDFVISWDFWLYVQKQSQCCDSAVFCAALVSSQRETKQQYDMTFKLGFCLKSMQNSLLRSLVDAFGAVWGDVIVIKLPDYYCHVNSFGRWEHTTCLVNWRTCSHKNIPKQMILYGS